MCHLPQIVQVLLEVLGTELSEEATNQRIVSLLQQLPDNLFANVVAQLPNERLRAKAQHIRH